MNKKGYKKSKSLYSVKKFHTLTSGGTIFENDHITILPNDGLYDMSLFSDSNFRYRVRSEENDKKRHSKSSWIKPEGSENEYWTMNNITQKEVSDESKIVLKPNYSSLTEFAYYGSAVELIHATINDIILRFPGGIYFYDEYPLSIWVGDVEYYKVANDFNIDCYKTGYISYESLKNPLRVLAASYKDYVDGENNPLTTGPEVEITGDCKGSIIGKTTFAGKTFLIYLDSDGVKHLIYEKSKHNDYKGKTIIKPNEKIINSFWETLDDFERVLLNRDTTPLYKATFETPYFTETGFYYTMKSYIWPTIKEGEFTPDISSGRFQSYIQSLLSLAQFHDEYDSDNIWRMMTHESIKNLDWTFTDNNGNVYDDQTPLDSGRIKKIINIQGRLYDDLKRNIDSIKSVNNISYNQNGNIPDYFLSDVVENNGWEAKSISNFSGVSDEIKYINEQKNKTHTAIIEKAGKTNSYINSSFFRRLALSSKYIQSMKGTRRGLEAIIGMFGYSYKDTPSVPGDFSISEYIVEAVGDYPNYCETSRLRAMFDYVNNDENLNFMQGYPVAKVELGDDDKDYLIPWFNRDMKYKYPIYFQSKGGWGKVSSKKINKNITLVTEIFNDNDLKLYSETSPYLRFHNNINDLIELPEAEIFNNLICYVEDISQLKTMGYNDGNNNSNYSHYFILDNIAFSTRLGLVDDCCGWRNIRNNEFDGTQELTPDGKKVLYLESITLNEKGNNSHTGRGNYDDGIDYFNQYKSIFGKDIEKGVTSKVVDEDDIIAIEKAGFELTDLQIDNKKCYYFSDNNSEIKDKVFYNPETKNRDRSEAAANSIINTKHLTIKFMTNGNDEMKQYIKDVVLKYAYEMIPSTTIVEVLFDNEKSLFNSPKTIEETYTLSWSINNSAINE